MTRITAFTAATIMLLLVTLPTGVCKAISEDTPGSEVKPQKEINKETEDEELKEIYENLPPEIKRQYRIPEDFFREFKEEPEKKGETKKEEKLKSVKTKETDKKEAEKKEKGLFEKIVEFLFGSEKKEELYKFKTTKQETIEEEQHIRNIRTFEDAKGEIKDIEQIEGLKPLDKIIETAIKNSPDVKKAKIEAEIIKRQNTFTPVPTFNIGNDLATGRTGISAGIQLPLEPLFTGKQREQYGELNIKQKEKEIEQKVIEQYKSILVTSKKIEQRREKVEYAKQLVRNAEEQYRGGVIKLDELIKAKELLWQTEADEENLKLELQTQIERLKTIEQGGK